MQKPYDKNKIGKFIGWGGEHLVFEYEDDKVIKFSMHVWLIGKTAVKKKIEDYKIGSKYFSKYLIPIDIRTWSKGRRAVEIQQKVNCRFFHRLDLKNPTLRHQFEDIITRYQRMKSDLGYGFDMFGREGLLGRRGKDEISNILVTEKEKLILIDFTAMHIRPIWYEWPLWLFIKWARRRQEYLLHKFI